MTNEELATLRDYASSHAPDRILTIRQPELMELIELAEMAVDVQFMIAKRMFGVL